MKRLSKFFVRIFASYMIEDDYEKRIRMLEDHIEYLEDLLLAGHGELYTYTQDEVLAQIGAIKHRKEKEKIHRMSIRDLTI